MRNVEDVLGVGDDSCRVSMSVLGLFQTVQSEYWWREERKEPSLCFFIRTLALTSSTLVDGVGSMLLALHSRRLSELVTDGDFLLILQLLVVAKGLTTAVVTKVKGPIIVQARRALLCQLTRPIWLLVEECGGSLLMSWMPAVFQVSPHPMVIELSRPRILLSGMMAVLVKSAGRTGSSFILLFLFGPLGFWHVE